MKNTLKKTLGIVLALALTLTAIGCGVAYADTYRGEGKASPVAVEKHKETAPSLSQTAPAAKSSVESSAAAPTKEALTVEQAKAIALEALGLSDAHFTDVERDDGKFELELCDGSREYDVEVVIRTGRVVEVDRDGDPCDRCEWDDDDWDDRYDDRDDRYDDDWDDDWDDRYDDDWDDRYDD